MKTDVVILGAGTAGLAAAREVSKQTDRFLLIDKGPLGTTCARVGCMPSKLLIEAANAFHSRHRFETFGIRHADKLRLDMAAVMKRVRALRDFYVSSTLKATGKYQSQLVDASARLLGPDRVLAGDEVIDCDRIIIATGSSPLLPDSWTQLGSSLLTTDNLFEQAAFAGKMAVIGLGAIGLEMAQALSRLGISVTAYGNSTQLAGLSDSAISDGLQQALDAELDLKLGQKAELSKTETGIEVKTEAGVETFDQVLAAIGRVPNINGLGLDTLGIELDDNGMPEVDEATLQLADLPVFMAGDVRGKDMLLHEAADDGRIAGFNAVANKPSAFCRRTLLHIVFSEPEVAVVGQRREALKQRDFLVGTVDFGEQGRARAAQKNAGRLAVYADKASGQLLGAEMAAPEAGHLSHILALAIQQQMTVSELLMMPFYHPVLEEGLRTALRDLQQQLETEAQFDLSRCDSFNSEALD
jgi:dihydrolipoamide dehydrogenase